MEIVVHPGGVWDTTVRVPGDKSLSHRALMFAAMAEGQSVVRGLSPGADVRSTARCLRQLGASFSKLDESMVKVGGWGRAGFAEPESVLNCGNSGTSMRLLAGLVSSRPGLKIMTGDKSLRSRPMGRIIEPLARMGAELRARQGDRLPPLVVVGNRLKAIEYALPVASAQVKSCLMLAALGADGTTRLRELAPTRDHTERMLSSLGVGLRSQGEWLEIEPVECLPNFEFTVPGDVSSAAFLLAATLVTPGAHMVVQGVGLNPGRTGFLDILKRMGGRLEVRQTGLEMGEPVGEIEAFGSELGGVEVGPEEVPGAIDELPLLAVVACQAQGTTRLFGAEELRHKESDRIAATVAELSRMGARISEQPDGFTIEGPCQLEGAVVGCHHDHRLEMGLAVAALSARGATRLRGAGWAAISFPNFWELFPGASNGR
ncbi:MAG: 3-phosphoshikimate 1-carboxyvinyltransferase [Candidatus Eremiobacteraeota bacterium]|nr:3-phosphoshikimate 1-carboxyvinyltransferase [Candidatus Eremiobacteraeota bacterium]